MKYVLGLLFEYKYYKNPANIKIFSNDQLIDDIDLTENIKMKNYYNRINFKVLLNLKNKHNILKKLVFKYKIYLKNLEN